MWKESDSDERVQASETNKRLDPEHFLRVSYTYQVKVHHRETVFREHGQECRS
jgi:hypothetical protein